MSTLSAFAFLLETRAPLDGCVSLPITQHQRSEFYGRDHVSPEGRSFRLTKFDLQIAGVKNSRIKDRWIERSTGRISVNDGVLASWDEMLGPICQLLTDSAKGSSIGVFGFSRTAPGFAQPVWQVKGCNEEIIRGVNVNGILRQPRVIGIHLVQQVKRRLKLKETGVLRHAESLHGDAVRVGEAHGKVPKRSVGNRPSTGRKTT